jgi:hypothetical protein
MLYPYLNTSYFEIKPIVKSMYENICLMPVLLPMLINFNEGYSVESEEAISNTTLFFIKVHRHKLYFTNKDNLQDRLHNNPIQNCAK